MNKIDWKEFDRLVKEMVEAGVSEALAKIWVYEKLKSEQEIYSPFKTINS